MISNAFVLGNGLRMATEPPESLRRVLAVTNTMPGPTRSVLCVPRKNKKASDMSTDGLHSFPHRKGHVRSRRTK